MDLAIDNEIHVPKMKPAKMEKAKRIKDRARTILLTSEKVNIGQFRPAARRAWRMANDAQNRFYIDGGQIDDLTTPHCECGRILIPAVAWADGEETTVGFRQCECAQVNHED